MKWSVNKVILIVVIAVFLGVNVYLLQAGHLPGRSPEGGFPWKTVGIIFAAAMTLAIYSFLYQDNPFFRVAENLFVGLGLGISVYFLWFNFYKPEIYEKFIYPAFSAQAEIYAKDYVLLLPVFLGILMLTRISRRFNWVSRYPLALLVGYWAGFAIPPTIESQMFIQAKATMGPIQMHWPIWLGLAGAVAALSVLAYLGLRRDRSGLIARITAVALIIAYVALKGNADFAEATRGVDTLLVLVGVLCVLSYFFFSAEHTGVLGATSNIGTIYLMLAFGASFGYTVMARESLLIGRLQFLLFEWLQIPNPWK